MLNSLAFIHCVSVCYTRSFFFSKGKIHSVRQKERSVHEDPFCNTEVERWNLHGSQYALLSRCWKRIISAYGRDPNQFSLSDIWVHLYPRKKELKALLLQRGRLWNIVSILTISLQSGMPHWFQYHVCQALSVMDGNILDKMLFLLLRVLPRLCRDIHNSSVSVAKSAPRAVNTFLDFVIFCVLVPESVTIFATNFWFRTYFCRG